MAFFVGQKVCCVDGGPSLLGLPCRLTEGAVYTVSKITLPTPLAALHGETQGLEVREHLPLPDVRHTAAFRASRFRPVVSTDISWAHEIVAPIFKQKRVKELVGREE